MKVLGINGSHRAGKGTAALLQAALDGAAEQGTALGVPVSGELVELSKLDIELCIGCNRCLAQTSCTLKDDMSDLYEKLRDADVILLASPDYFGTVSARMKNFMDRTRPFHMVENVLAGKIGGALATAGLNNCGGEGTLALLDSWFATQGMLAVHPRRRGGHGVCRAEREGPAPVALGEGRRNRFCPGAPAGPRGRLAGRAPAVAVFSRCKSNKSVPNVTNCRQGFRVPT